MLKFVSSDAAMAKLLVCSTCRLSADAREDADGRRGGEILAAELHRALETHACRDRVQVQPMPCLFACSTPCSVYLRGPGRMGYVLGKFAPTPKDAVALLDYIAHYLDSAEGVVPYGLWPEGVKGHFLVRVPPDGMVWQPPIAVSNAQTVSEGE